MFINNQGLLSTPNPSKEICNAAFFNITNCGHQNVDENFTAHHIVPRYDMKLLYVLKGPIKNEQNGIITTIPVGNLLYYKPEEITTTYFFSPETEVYWIHFYGKAFEEIIDKMFPTNISTIDIGVNIKIIDLFNKMILYMKFHKENYEIFCSGLLMQIFGIIQEKQNNQTSNTPKSIQKAIKYLEENYTTSIPVKTLAKTAGLSESFFFKSFKKNTTMSPYLYQKNLRLNAAVEYLEHTTLSIKEISEKIGYEDPFTFSRSFKLKYGVSPKNYRNKEK